MNAHSKTTTELFYLELGIYPLKYHLSKRRFMYLWHILHTDKSEFIRKVYDSQKFKTIKGYWVKIIEVKKVNFDIQLSDDEVVTMPRGRFENMIKKKIRTHSTQQLKNVGLTHSKSICIANQKFGKKSYLSDRRMSKEDIQLLFKLRTRMVDCKSNFEGQYREDMSCRACKVIGSVEDEDHILSCLVLKLDSHDIKFRDVYGSMDQQYKATQVFKKILRRRKVYLDVTYPSS